MVFGFLLLVSDSRAQDNDSTVRKHAVSIGIDPFFLLAGAIWSKAEVMLLPSWSVAGHFAMTIDGNRHKEGLVGADICWYPIGTFEHGIQLIAHVAYRHDSVFFNGPKTGPEIPGYHRSLGYGAMIGFKYIFPIELTGNFQIGLLREEDQTTVAMEAYNDRRLGYGLWGYFNLGWSF